MITPSLPVGTAPTSTLTADLCVVGGGMSGVCAAIAAARRGSKVILLQDRPVLGGNASSEIRMWICGAHGRDAKETGILEEIQLENCYRNQQLNYSVWDTVLYEKARFQEGLTLLLSCAVCEVEMDGDRIAAIKAWHLTEQRWVRVEAALFADCSGDSILRLSGAETRWGREARHEFGESHAPEVADRKTMGNSLLLQLREIDPADHRPFIAPEWAHRFDDSHRRIRENGKPQGHNFWWIEIGGEQDTIAEADAIRDELYRIAFGVWAYIKNHPDGRGQRWELEWLGHLPGKRENVRYLGDHVLSQTDVESCGRFDDVVCHGGWSMDDHFPAAFEHDGPPTIFHPAPSPYGIPYRCLYSRNIANLFCAGRNISCTHMAMSSTRVMATCATMGQAVGTAAAIATAHGTTPRGVYERHLRELQNTLLEDDQYLPGRLRPLPTASIGATLTASHGDPAPLHDGLDRRIGDEGHWFHLPVGGWIEHRFAAPTTLGRLRLIGDSQLHRQKRMPCSWPLKGNQDVVPPPLPRDLTIAVERQPGVWEAVALLTDNRRRLIQVPLAGSGIAVRVTIDRTWGADQATLFACDVGVPVRDGAIAVTEWPSQVVHSHASA